MRENTVANERDLTLQDKYGSLKVANLELGDIKGIKGITLERLKLLEEDLQELGFDGGLPLYFAMQESNLSALERQLGIHWYVLAIVFDYYQIPRLNATEARRKNIEKIRRDPEFESKRVQAIESAVRDPGYRARMSRITEASFSNPKIREKILKGQAAARERPGYREKMVKVGEKFQARVRGSQELRDKTDDALREYWADPENADKWKLPTVQGFRRDIGYFAQSTWEANFARVLIYLGRRFKTKESFIVKTGDYSELFRSGKAQFIVDFLVTDERGNLTAYDLLATPHGVPVRMAKVELLKRQFPHIKIHIIDKRLYRLFERKFKDRINSSPNFCGWETKQDNLRNNPEKYS